MKHCLTYIFLFLLHFSYGQNKTKDSIPYQNDTIVIREIVIDEVKLIQFKPLKFKSTKDKTHYYWLRKKVYHAYPYAKLAADKLEALNKELTQIKSKRKRKKHTKKVQKYLEGAFTNQLKKLTRKEGQILVKLVHRQTGITTHQLVKNLRSGWKAFWYQRTAKLFKINLKDTYNPTEIKEDYLIEDILQRFFAKGILDEQEQKIDFNYMELTKKWRD
jgi:hypothetical protein